MGNILDYIAWRGDLTLKQSGFCDVDNLILSQISYMQFDQVVSSDTADCYHHAQCSISEASEKLFSIRKNASKGLLMSDQDNTFLKALAGSRRFGNMRLAGYVSHIDEEEEKQFAAITIFLGDGTAYVSYRGTDDTLVGWKEDLNMSFITPVPSQLEALEYLNRVVTHFEGKLRVGGHSKGGNLAVYAASFCETEVRRRIRAVYSNDGPGISEEYLSKSNFERIAGRVHSFVPQSSVVGMLLGNGTDYTVVHSTQSGLYQHDPYSWEIIGNHFVCLDQVSRKSMFMDVTLKEWIASMDNRQRKTFVDAMYRIIQATEARTLLELSVNGLKTVKQILKTMGELDEPTRKMIQATFAQLMTIARKNMNLQRHE